VFSLTRTGSDRARRAERNWQPLPRRGPQTNLLQDEAMPVPVPSGRGGRGCGSGRDGDGGSGTAALGNISLHLSNEAQSRENTHGKGGKEQLLGNKIKVLL